MKVLRHIATIAAVAGLMEAARATGELDPRHLPAAVLLAIGMILLASWHMGKLFAAAKLPKLTGYLAAGIVAGPAVLAYLDHQVVSALTIVNGMATALIALTAGSEMDFRAMRPLMRSIGWISVIAVIGTAIVLGVTVFVMRDQLSFLADRPLLEAIAIAATLGVVIVAQSPAVVVAIRAETGADGAVARTALGVVVVADLVVIVLFALASSVTHAALAGSMDVEGTLRALAWELFGSLGLGVVIGVLLAVYHRVVRVRVDLFVLVVCFLAAEIGRRLHLDPLLLMLAAGMFVENVAHAGHALRAGFEDASLPVYILFFTVAGASIHLDLIPLVAVPATVLVVVRACGLYAGTYAAARLADAPPSVAKWGGFGLLPQAGLAIALSMLFARTFPEFGDAAGVLTLGIVSINELIAPALFRFALARAGEAVEGNGTSADH
ncbi:cation:proton antiporter [Sandaracinus amylolyticus]|uniref:cation:proton antiporter n=1 Tax=Sandaracinus amylolyticus TaxID=927083 RepID=UPI001F1C94CE|nr:cation:proton antiporter [Sandaracinus amylolyticus]UJR83771.1 Hypothetical protein I5071_58420 [Sandaracinus amylolyticus]